MTLPLERARAVRETERFLSELCNPKLTPRVPLEIRQKALWCLRHYPSLYHLEIVEQYFKSDIVECPFSLKDDVLGVVK